GSLLINAARGEVVDNVALREHLQQGQDLLTVFDVWEDEPAVDAQLVRQVDIASPHIAGYSVEAKLAASQRNFRDFLAHFRLSPPADLAGQKASAPALQLPAGIQLRDICSREKGAALAVAEAVCAAFPLAGLSERFKDAAGQEERASLFDSLR